MSTLIDHRYRIVGELGAGSAGLVLAVEDEGGRKALKFLVDRSEDEKDPTKKVTTIHDLGRFKSEFLILTELSHPGIGRILDFGFDDHSGQYYFTSELIAGVDFYMASEHKDFAEIESMAVQTLRALNYLHARGIFHFDIKPQNILVTEQGGKLLTKLIDFGLAGLKEHEKPVGTPAYMAPEMILGGTLDGRTDLYSFGVLLYKTLTRTNPFVGKFYGSTLERHKTLIAKPPSAVNPALPKFWDRIIMRLLEKNPSERYPDAATVIRDFNFLANRNHEIETQDTRLSYLPSGGKLIGRQKASDIFVSMFDLVFSGHSAGATKLLIIEGKAGTGRTRLLNEFKYHSQLREVPVYSWLQFDSSIKPPFMLQLDTTDSLTPDQVASLAQQYANEPHMILWATTQAPVGWSQAELVTLHHYTEPELGHYLTMVIGIHQPPELLVREIYQRTEGNPLFVTELLKTLLQNNLLLDAQGRWASATFEDIGINFDKIQVPKTLSGLLMQGYQELDSVARAILDWMAVFGGPLSLADLQALTAQEQLQKAILVLTKADLIERDPRGQEYFIKNVLLRESVYTALAEPARALMHDRIVERLKTRGVTDEAVLCRQRSRGSHPQHAIDALYHLAAMARKQGHFKSAVVPLTEAWQKVQTLSLEEKVSVQTHLAEALAEARDFKTSLRHFQELKNILDGHDQLNRHLDKRIHVYTKLGDLYTKLGEHQKALTLFESALAWLGTDPSHRVQRMLISNFHAGALMKAGQLAEARLICADNFQLWEKDFSDQEKKLISNNALADIYLAEKRYDDVIHLSRKMILFYGRAGNIFCVARHNHLQGKALLAQVINLFGGFQSQKRFDAVESFNLCLALAKEIGAIDLMIAAYNELGNLYYYGYKMSGSATDLDAGSDCYKRAIAMAQKNEDIQTAAALAYNLANLYSSQKKYRDAYPHYIYVINTLEVFAAKTTHDITHLFSSLADLSLVHLKLGEAERAEASLNRAEKLFQKNETLKTFEFYLQLRWAQLYHQKNQTESFEAAFNRAKVMAKDELELKELKEVQEELFVEAGPPSSPPPAQADIGFPRPRLQHSGTGSSGDPGFVGANNYLPLPSPPEPVLDSRNRGQGGQPMENNSAITAKQLESILQLNKLINAESNLEHLFKLVLSYALELSGAENGLVLLVGGAGVLEVRAAVNIIVDEQLKRISTSIALEALRTGEVILAHDALTDGRFDASESVVLNELKSILCLPLKSRNKVLGVLYLDNRVKTDAFKHVNLGVLHAYCDQVGIALENARLLGQYEVIQQKLETDLEKTTEELKQATDLLNSGEGAYRGKYSYQNIIARSKPMQDLFQILDKITATTLAVFIHGASGTGKELIARALHFNNPIRAGHRFVAINCGAIPVNLIESELFGYKAGSFTGADKDKKGLFEEANGGTLLLDEIAELDIQLQVKLLRVLQEGEVHRIGDVKPIKVDVRIVSASHKPIEKLIQTGAFREDLFYRLCQIKLDIPPLAQRKEDIPVLAEHFVNKFKKQDKVSDEIRLTPALLKLMVNYDWPGNVRELENVVFVACALRSGNYLDVSCLPPNYGISKLVAPKAEGNLSQNESRTVMLDEENKLEPERTWPEYAALIIAKCFAFNNYKKGETAEMLGISPSTLYKKIKEHLLEDKTNPIYAHQFVYIKGRTLKSYLPKIFKAALSHADNHPYAAIRKLGVSQGYFYKVMKIAKE